MSADTISNPQPAGESKTARKKREKAQAQAAAEAPAQTDDGQKTPEVADTNGDAFESSYVKELQKSVLCLSVPQIVNANPRPGTFAM